MIFQQIFFLFKYLLQGFATSAFGSSKKFPKVLLKSKKLVHIFLSTSNSRSPLSDNRGRFLPPAVPTYGIAHSFYWHSALVHLTRRRASRRPSCGYFRTLPVLYCQRRAGERTSRRRRTRPLFCLIIKCEIRDGLTWYLVITVYQEDGGSSASLRRGGGDKGDEMRFSCRRVWN